MKANEAPEKIYMTPSFGEPDNVTRCLQLCQWRSYHRADTARLRENKEGLTDDQRRKFTLL